MIQAYLVAANGAKRPIRQTGDVIVIRHQRMEIGPGGPIASHKRHYWELEGDKFLVMKIDSRVLVRLESGAKSREFGPFDQLWLVDGLVLSDLDQENPVAHFEHSTNSWHVPADKTVWESVTFVAV